MAPARRGWRPAIPAAVAGASLSVCAGLAFGAGGAITPPQPPRVTDVVCISKCGGVRKATTASRVKLSGRHLRQISKVSFSAKRGGRIEANPIAGGSRAVTARVPAGAVTGKPKVIDAYDNSARSPSTLRIVGPGQIQAPNFKLRDASAKPRDSYYYGTRKPRVTYMFTNSEPTNVRIEVVRRKNGKVVDSWVQRAREPYTRHTASWKGIRRGTKRPARNGAYKFRLGPESGTMASTSDARFKYHRFKFPIRGRHSYGDGVGAPRVGHSHQGQDLLARCGTPLVAARGGRVQWKGYQAGGAGYYLVIDGKKTGRDYAYMHMKGPAKVDRGKRVRTGQRVGKVGSSGGSTGCHLHFEEWSAPGWYQGGHHMKAVTRHLKRWDRWS
jgi:murein DD-endopeptidase MepM/ murein hydrolase activator NlpD